MTPLKLSPKTRSIIRFFTVPTLGAYVVGGSLNGALSYLEQQRLIDIVFLEDGSIAIRAVKEIHNVHIVRIQETLTPSF